ncbi:alpha/beta hydrolase family protein [Nonomuraea sp. NPDC050536]|uniref:alpha/beta hydrolase family protein n=1 Tax=Nonomuraea sp. NPDC050536 TaxID=3364366 RepID=UPI0037CC918B
MALDGISRRSLLGGAALVAASLATIGVARADTPKRLRLPLPAPTGPHAIGTVSKRLVDRSRKDPWLPTRDRELMVSVWYPAHPGGGQQRAPWMTSAALAKYRPELERMLTQTAQMRQTGDGTISLAGVEFPTTHARYGAPVRRAASPYPVLLFSPGAAADREEHTTIAEDLASHGYIVITLGHTYDAAEIEFPGGRVEVAGPPLSQDGSAEVLKARYADALFVLDSLDSLDSLDVRPGKIGMFGHSLGGATTAQAMAHDRRVLAGIDLDGTPIPDVAITPPDRGGDTTPEKAAELAGAIARKIGDRPFMIMSSNGQGPQQLGALMDGFWSNLSGWRRFLSVKGTTHGSYTDAETLMPELVKAGRISAGLAAAVIGPSRVLPAQRAYIRAFFDRHLRGMQAPLLDGPSADYPDVIFFPAQGES